ncbi:hypothetical protein HG530_004941 [Fusarium avenaceum]|nr:hypothetical protein HG530_004941 [Fusarium avenaceum]
MAEGEDEESRDPSKKMRRSKRNGEPTDTNEIVVETAKEQTHDEHNSREAQIIKNRHFDKWRPGRLLLEITLPEEECDNDTKRNNDKRWDPRRSPPNDVSLGERKHQRQEAAGDERRTDPVDGRRLGPEVVAGGLELGRRRWDTEDACHGDHAGHYGEGAEDPFPTGPLGDKAGDEVAADAAEGGTSS